MDHPGWELWAGAGGVFYARWLNTSPPVILSGPSFGDLEERIPRAERAWVDTHSYWATIKAAAPK